MTTPAFVVQDDTAEITAEQATAAETAEAEGFTSAVESTDLETDTLTEPQNETTPVEPDAPATPEPEVEPPPVKMAEITDEAFQELLKKATKIDQIEAAFAQRFDGIGGKLGVLQQVLNELKTGSAGKKAEISRDDLKELLEEFPEFGERAIVGLNRALAKVHVGGGSAGLTKEEVGEIVAQAEVDRETRRLTKKHSDWKEVIGPHPTTLKAGEPMSAYHQWLLTQPKAYQDTLNNSVDSDEIGESIVKFKEATKKPAPVTPKPPATGRAAELRRAIQPSGTGGPAATSKDTDDEAAAMRKAFAEEQKQFAL